MTASVQDVATQLGRPIDEPSEVAQVTAWLELADMLIRQRYPNLDQLIADGRISVNAVDLVEASAVARYSRNPEGFHEPVGAYRRLSDHVRDDELVSRFDDHGRGVGFAHSDGFRGGGCVHHYASREETVRCSIPHGTW